MRANDCHDVIDVVLPGNDGQRVCTTLEYMSRDFLNAPHPGCIDSFPDDFYRLGVAIPHEFVDTTGSE